VVEVETLLDVQVTSARSRRLDASSHGRTGRPGPAGGTCRCYLPLAGLVTVRDISKSSYDYTRLFH
jgi:hypothetical protein